MTNVTRGGLLMLLSCLMMAIVVNIVRYVSADLSTAQIVFFRNAVALLLFLPWVMRIGIGSVKTTQMKLHFVRVILSLVAMYLWFYALVKVPLSVATSLSFTAPLFTALLAIFFFSERYGIHRTTALIIGFIGVLIVLHPGTEDFDANALLAVGAAFFWSLAGITIKFLTQSERPKVVAFYMVVLMTPLSLPAALWDWQPVPFDLWPWLLGLGIASNMYQLSISRAIALTEFAVILPIDFTRLIFVAIIAWYAFGEVVDMWTIIGGCVIMAGAIYAAIREARRGRKLGIMRDAIPNDVKNHR